MVVIGIAYRPKLRGRNHLLNGLAHRQLGSYSGLGVEAEGTARSLRTVPVGRSLIVVWTDHLHAGRPAHRAFQRLGGRDVWTIVSIGKHCQISFLKFGTRKHIASNIPGYY